MGGEGRGEERRGKIMLICRAKPYFFMFAALYKKYRYMYMVRAW